MILRWILSLFGLGPKKSAAGPTPAPRPREARPAQAPGRRTVEKAAAPETVLAPEAEKFLLDLVTPIGPADLQALPPDDRVFLSGVLKRINDQQVAIPLLPRAALEISRLLANPNCNVGDFVRVLETDPALSVDVLRVANSSFYGFSGPTQSVHNAVLRIGMNQIRGLIVVAHLHGKVLQGGSFQAEAGWLSQLSMGLAHLAQDVASALALEPSAAFTRGVLYHVEHFIVMGTANEVSRELHRKIAPSAQGFLEALRRAGPRVREAAARSWHLEDLMLDSPDQPQLRARFAELERGLVARWTRQDLAGTVEGVAPEQLESATGRLAPGASRVDAAQPA